MSDHIYDTGYGKPPKNRRFTKGKSGNPKGSKNLATSFIEIGRERITATEGRRTRTMTKAEAVVHQLTNKAASGDPRARREYFQVHKMFQATESGEEITPELSNRDNNLMKNFWKRMDRMGKTKSDEPSTANTMETKEETE